MRNKANEIAQDAEGGRNTADGVVRLGNGTECRHWRAGDYRLFGTVESNRFTFLGWGTHSGRDSRNYSVTLCSGRSTTATIAR